MSLLLIALLGLISAVTFATANGTGTAAVVAMAIFFPAAATLYFAPVIVAQEHKHPNTMAIGVLNLLAGWTVLGWIGALVWAYTMPSLDNGSVEVAVDKQSMKTCPFCAEPIRIEAVICRYCRSEV